MIFPYLIVPAVCGILTARRFGVRLAIGVALSLVGDVTGLMVSFYQDLPSGAAIVCVFGVLLVLTAIGSIFTKEKPRRVDA